MGFLMDLNDSLKEESQLIINVTKLKNNVQIRILDSEKKGIKNAKKT